jgi:hypothetical protein
MIHTAPSIMFWMRTYPLLGEVGGGWALEFLSFLGLVKWHRTDRRVPFQRCIGYFKHMSPLVTFTGCILGRSRAHNCGEWRSR